jgi:hypothetical protein
VASTNSTQTRSTGIGGVSASAGYGPANINAQPRSNLFGGLLGMFTPKINPYQEAGRMGTAVWGGFVENLERDRRLYGQNRYRTASDILANVSIVAAGLRFVLGLAAAPAWSVKPAVDLPDGKSSDQAKELADFAQDIIDDLGTSWKRVVRRSCMYKFHGFGVYEITAKRREDGLIGVADIEQRPQVTIERWELADDGTIIGMWQRWPQNGELLFLPRDKVCYLVDDEFTDSPEGLGLFRHLVDPAERLRRYLKMEGIGYEREMKGLPLGRAPLNDIRKQIEAGNLNEAQGQQLIQNLQRFLQLQVKEEDTSLMLDSSTYLSPTADGYTVSAVAKWGMELLGKGGDGQAFQELNKSLDRLTHDMARIIGVESMLLGGTGGGGSGGGGRALAEDKSRNLYLLVDGIVGDLSEGYRRDMLGFVWKLNGLPMRLMPKFHTEDVAFKDVEQITKALADMATAGAIMDPQDPAINDLRDLMGISHQPDNVGTQAAAAALLPRTPPPKSGGVTPAGAAPAPLNEPGSSPGGGKGPNEPGPSPAPPGSPEPAAGGATRRNRTSHSTPGAEKP